jgi:hypothetical protein
MKQIGKIALFSLLFLIAFSSCTKEVIIEEEDVCTTSVCRGLGGEWNLMQYSGGLAGLETYNKDEVTWTFNSNGTVDVLINITLGNSIMPIQTTQTNTYVVNGTIVQLGTGQEYDIAFDNGQLILSRNPELDGPRIAFERD